MTERWRRWEERPPALVYLAERVAEARLREGQLFRGDLPLEQLDEPVPVLATTLDPRHGADSRAVLAVEGEGRPIVPDGGVHIGKLLLAAVIILLAEQGLETGPTIKRITHLANQPALDRMLETKR